MSTRTSRDDDVPDLLIGAWPGSPEHRARATAQLEQLHADLAVIDWKIAAYQAAEDGAEPPPPPAGWSAPQPPIPDGDSFTRTESRLERP